MRRTLSSPLTFFWKFVSTPLLAGCFILVLAVGWSGGWKHRDGTPVSGGEIAIAIICQTATFAWLVFLSARLKRVEVDDNSLYVSNYRTEILVPLSEIAGVRETSPYWFTIIVTLKSSSSFGGEIVFRPRHRFYLSGLHPIARQLNELAEQAHREATGRDRKNPSSKQPATATRPDITA